MKFDPVDLRPVGEHELLVTWKDQHRSLFHCRELRFLCPCAYCVDEWSGKRTVDPDHLPEQIKVFKTEPVGRYGLKFYWSDGHSTGIYSFDYLRSLCPCAHCKKESGNAR